MKRIWIMTLFPEYFVPFLAHGVAGNTLRENEQFELKIINIRDFALNRYKSVDDTPYGGGPGMVMMAEVLENALLTGIVRPSHKGADDLALVKEKYHIVFPSPRGQVWNNDQAKTFAEKFWSQDNSSLFSKDIIFICGRYEGIDERFISRYVDEEFSIGDYVLTGGEIAAMTILDSALRFVPGVLGNLQSSVEDSFYDGLLDFPHYTKPRTWQGMDVPEVLLGGHHANIKKWQQEQKYSTTQKFRPDLLEKFNRKKVEIK